MDGHKERKQTNAISKELLDNVNRFLGHAEIYPSDVKDVVVKCPDCGCEKIRSKETWVSLQF
jgi:hypothetical protein